ncbi:hypothetical protein RB6918 [Rhodopirellula baltica SH 1]|uniref:Uncharacterized protein n=1 Tax=Rhodopirellula baltica (strain DSM 10527 / NCIMB 13988 / SH1) TaxID=243090 RepID=Q7UPI2_RHOBA|nr:hypothetical protein RB6918 [Rhodopirellula baltica SH 1]
MNVNPLPKEVQSPCPTFSDFQIFLKFYYLTANLSRPHKPASVKISTLSSRETPVGVGVRFPNGKFRPIACVRPMNITGVTFRCT